MKQEEIIEGVKRVARETWYKYDHDIVWDEIAKAVVTYLDSKGVVIKVKGKLPKIPDLMLQDGIRSQMGAKLYVNAGIDLLFNAGYTLTEPLLEVKDD